MAEGPEHRSPRIAVVVPFRNRRAVLRRAVDSVLRQAFPDFELILVDDGSTDDGHDAVADIVDARVRLVRQPRRMGANAARNRGVRETGAPIISFLDSDDEFLPEKLGQVLDMFDRQPDLGTLVDSYLIVNPDRFDGRPEPLINRPIEGSDAFLEALFDSTVRARRVRKATSAMTVRRDVALRAGLFNEQIHRRQDMEFLVRLAKTARCATTDRLLWIKHEIPDSITFTGDGFIAATMAMARDHPEYAERSTRMSADIWVYLWETVRRRQYARAAADVSLLRREFGFASASGMIVRGFAARVIAPSVRTLFRR